MEFQFVHYNYNVMDLKKSIAFYEEALGLKEVRRKEAQDWKLYFSISGRWKVRIRAGINMVT